MIIDGVEYVPKNKEQGSVKIVVLQRGWVYVGFYSRDKSECVLDNSKCIRSWGTTKGLGELISGPTSSTKLDDAGTVKFHRISEILTLDCEEEKWKKHLK